MNTDSPTTLMGRDLVAVGWHPGKRLGAALRRGIELEASGLPRAAALAALELEFPKQLQRVYRRPVPLPLAEAILVPDGAAEEERLNLVAVRRQMADVLRSPVVRHGAVMPDACPVGGAEGTMPVGGVIEVDNAVVPGAHSSDVCCSVMATFLSGAPDWTPRLSRIRWWTPPVSAWGVVSRMSLSVI